MPGSADASYDEFVRAHWAALFRTSYLLTGSRHEAEDLLQTALLRAFEHWAKVQSADAPLAYVKRMLVNELTSWRRTATRRASRRQLLGPPEEAPTSDLDGQIDLWRLVRELPPRQRAVVVLRYYEDLTETEIAGTLGISRGTVKSQASDALRRLAALADGSPSAAGRKESVQ